MASIKLDLPIKQVGNTNILGSYQGTSSIGIKPTGFLATPSVAEGGGGEDEGGIIEWIFLVEGEGIQVAYNYLEDLVIKLWSFIIHNTHTKRGGNMGIVDIQNPACTVYPRLS